MNLLFQFIVLSIKCQTIVQDAILCNYFSLLFFFRTVVFVMNTFTPKVNIKY